MKENEISKLKETYPPGTRIVLMYMGYDPHPIDSNTRETVDHVDDMIERFTFSKADNSMPFKAK